MTKITWSGAQDSNWFNPNNWNPAIVPGSGDTIVIPAGLTTQPTISDGNVVTFGANISNAGIISVNSTGDNTDLVFNGAVVLSGGGTIALSDNPNNRIYSTQGSSTLDNKETISGAGQIFSNGNLSLVNDTTGVIDANGVNTLVVSNIGVTNENVLESTNTTAGSGGLYLLSDTIDNTQNSNGGLIEALGANSHVDLNNSHIKGGTLTTTGGGVIQTVGNSSFLDGTVSGAPVTISTGSTVKDQDGLNLTVSGAITNNGTLTLTSGQDGVHFDNTDLIVNGATTFSGTGGIVLSDFGANNRIYSNVGGTVLDNRQTISGAGQIFSNGNLSLLNDTTGVVNANGMNTLGVNLIGVTNKHILESTNTNAGNGGLLIQAATIDSTQNSNGGMIEALGANSHVDLNATHIIGGTLTTTGGGVIQTVGNNSFLDGTTAGAPVTISTGSTVKVQDGLNLTVSGAIDNNGTLTLTSGQDGVHFDNTDLIVNGNTTFSGTGGIVLSDVGANGQTNRIFSTAGGTTLDNQQTISGAGQIFSNGNMGLLNDTTGIVDANGVNTFSINTIGVTNENILESTNTTAGNGGLNITTATINNTSNSNGGLIEALGANSHVDLNNAHIIGGTLTTTGGGVIQTVGNSTFLDGTTTSAPLTISTGSTVKDQDSLNLTVSGSIDNNGTLTLTSGQDGVHFDNTDLIVNGATTFSGTGGIVLSDVGANGQTNRIYSNVGGTVLDNQQTISGAGEIVSNGGNMGLLNDTTGVVNANGKNTLSINNIGVTNEHILESTNTTAGNGGLNITTATINNTQNSNGGLIEALGANSHVDLNNAHIIGGTLTTTGGGVIRTVGNSTFLDGTTAGAPLTISTGSTVKDQDSLNLTVSGAITNNGTLNLTSGQDGVHFDNTDLIVNGNTTFSGTGGIVLSDVGANGQTNRIYSNAGGTTLDNQQTISGAGQIFSNGNLGVLNDTAGVVNANGVNTLSIHNIGVTNEHILESTNTTAGNGGLNITSATINNTSNSNGGLIEAIGANSHVDLNASDIIGGTLTTTGSGVIQTVGNSTLFDGTTAGAPLTISTGSTVKDQDGLNLTLAGSSGANGNIVNQGTLSLNSGQNGVNFDNTDLIIGNGGGGGTVFLNGGGKITLSNSGANRIYSNAGSTTLDNVNNLISGAGQIFSNGNMNLVNGAAGLIFASSFTTQLTINNITVSNQGEIAATNSAGLALTSMTMNQSGAGSLRALGGGVDLNNADIVGGSLISNGPYSIQTAGDSSLLNGSGALAVTIAAGSNVIVNDGQNLSLAGTIANSGTLWLFSGENGVNFDNTDLLIDGTVNLTGTGGTVLLSPSHNNRIFSNVGGSQLNNVSDAIEGAGQIFSNGNLSLDNESGGTIAALSGDTLTVQMGFANTGVLMANGGTLDLQGAVTGSGTGSVANGGVLEFDSTQSLANLNFASANAGEAILSSIGTTPTINGYGYNDAIRVNYATAPNQVLSLQYASTGPSSGTLTVEQSISGGPPTALVSFTVNGVYTAQSFALVNSGTFFTITGTADTWNGSSGTWSTGTNWSNNAAPGTNSDAAVTSGAPTISAGIGTIRSLTVGHPATVDFAGVTGNTISSSVVNSGAFQLDGAPGQGGASVKVGTLFNEAGGSATVGNTTLSAADSLNLTSLQNFGNLSVAGSASNQALVNVSGAAGFGTKGILSGGVSLSGDSAIEFASGGIGTIFWGGSLRLNGALSFVELASGLNANSALTGLTKVNGALYLDNGASLTATGTLYTLTPTGLLPAGLVAIDDLPGSGGSSLKPAALRNLGALDIGNSTLSSSDLVQTASLFNTGAISLTGGTSAQALLNVTTGAAGFGQTGIVTGTAVLSGNSAIEFASGQISTIFSGGELQLIGPKAFVEDGATNTSSALTGLASIAGALSLDNGGLVSATVGITNSGTIAVDSISSEGGSSLTSLGQLKNSNALTIGNTALTSSDSVTAASLNNTGEIGLYGSATAQALLNIKGAAGFGAAGVLTGAVTLGANSAIEFASGSIATIAAGSSLTLGAANGYIEDGVTNSNSALTGLTSVLGTLLLENGAAIASTKPIANSGTLSLDPFAGEGGSSLSTTAALTNSGTLGIGNAGLASSDSVTIASLSNTGAITLAGAGSAQALLNVNSAAGFGTAATLTGTVTLGVKSAIEFASGQISTIATGASLKLGSSRAFVEDGVTNTNSALTGLTSVAGTLTLDQGAVVASTKALTNTGAIALDAVAGEGGSSLSSAGTLTNKGALTIGNATLSSSDGVAAALLSNTGQITLSGFGAAQALLNISGAAGFGTAGTLTGNVTLGAKSAIEFGSGEIATITGGASLALNAANSYIEDGATNSNSALTGLSTVASSATLTMNNGATVSTSLALTNAGTITLDAAAGAGGAGLSSSGALTNSGTLTIGNSTLSSSDSVAAASLKNTGQLSLTGSASGQALMTIGGAAGFGTAGNVSGAVTLTGKSAISFGSGQISTIASGASLRLGSGSAYIEDGVTNSNSALTGLSGIVGNLILENGAAIASTLATSNTGSISLDGSSGDGGSRFSTTQKLSNFGSLSIGNSTLSALTSVSVGSISSTGKLSLAGNGPSQALLDVGSAAGFGAAGELYGTVTLGNNSAIEFASGAITAIATGASLTLGAANAYIEDGASNSNSALSGLATIVGNLALDNGASVTTASLNNRGGVFVDAALHTGGSQLSVTGGLTNSGTLNIGNSSPTGEATASAQTLTNTGSINLTGAAELAVSGTAQNNGAVYLISDSEQLAAAITGTGTFDLFNNSSLEFGSTVSAGQTVTYHGAGGMTLSTTNQFAGTIAGFGTNDSADLASLLFQTGASPTFTENGGGTGGTLSVTSGATTVNLLMSGVYTTADFHVGADSVNPGAGTLITFV